MSLIQFRLTLSFSTSSMADLPSFSTEEFYWLASFFWGHHHLQTSLRYNRFYQPFLFQRIWKTK
ncbi:hypothetical protein ERO13_D10G000266v2 [Gossypium hirsutum]|uniref:Uncharacterized protein n=4 Tax=Gossypium TaxID=3633 RepID=A0A5J5PKG5_GOSBA|nr:hypothetical protein ES319_D10G000900v1 [Gossypium barbadense]KAG4123812.1 hypothetical protein ERO13_D10G000266v2 [Gossypium hirsutum]TYG48273.1 hypothetical protein ES288_D10G000700v1 [Gossypium darwinii]TYH47489.1 hypothetical protein ES332_D10G001100v1 [Gossypium tomentosum]TYI58977.1 hypothetical protein E1A91_D10G001000v1 [Gossypium mustelinum]